MVVALRLQGRRNLAGVREEGKIAPPDFGKNKSRTVSFKMPWTITCPSKFTDFPTAQAVELCKGTSAARDRLSIGP